MPTTRIRFNDIREHNGSQDRAWEELTYILASDLDDLPTGVRLERRGTPDGGVEFTCSSPNEDEAIWGWQAKYLFKYDAQTFAQMRRSFRDALGNHPNLSRYSFVLPANPPDGPLGTSGFKKWLDFKTECEAHARKAGAKVEVVLHTGSDVLGALLNEKHAGAVLYFFDVRFPTAAALATRVASAVSDLGDRYDADLNVETEFSSFVDALCLDDVFVAEVSRALRWAETTTVEAARALGHAPAASKNQSGGNAPTVTVSGPAEEAHGSRSYGYAPRSLEDGREDVELGEMEWVGSTVVDMVAVVAGRLSTSVTARLPDIERRANTDVDALASLLDASEEAFETARQEIGNLIKRTSLELENRTAATPADGPPNGESEHLKEMQQALTSLRSRVTDASNAIAGARRLLTSRRFRAAQRGALLVVGEAGCGKSHTLADVTVARVKRDLPSVFVLGHHLQTNTSLPGELSKMVNLDLTWSEVLAGLQTAAQVRSAGRALIVVDAINEGAGAELWRDRLAGLLTEIENFPMVAVLISVRDTYERSILTEAAASQCVRVRHPGLAGHEHEAVAMYAAKYGLSLPAIPPLVPEFTNPLLLRSTCRATRQHGLTSLPMVAMGDEWIFGGLMDAVNAAISAPKMLDKDEVDRVGQRAVRALAEHMVNRQEETLPLGEAREVCRAIVDDGGKASQSLLGALEREGILLRQPGGRNVRGVDGSTRPEDRIQFTYQRMSDHVRAHVLADLHSEPGGLATALTDQFGTDLWRHTGLLEALAVLSPSRYGVEFVDAVAEQPMAEAMHYDLGQGLLRSLPRRSADTITERSVELIDQFIRDRTIQDDEWLEVLITLACVPDHPLNIDFLDRSLRNQTLVERDSSWTVNTLALWTAEENALARTIDWLWGTHRDLPLAQATQAATLMGWLLTSTSRRLRDSVTKVLVEIVDERTALLTDLISGFEEVNDPYVRERLLAVAAGHVSRTKHTVTSAKTATELLELCQAAVRLARTSRPNIMVTHYTEHLLAQVGNRLPQTDLPTYRPPSTTWPLTAPTIAVLADRLEGRRRDHLYGSPIGYDFSEYILKRGTCRDFVPPDQRRLRRLRKRNASARYRRAIAQLAEATAKPAAEIESVIAERTPRTSLHEIRAKVRAKRVAMQRATDDAPIQDEKSNEPLADLLAELGYHGGADPVDDTSETAGRSSAHAVRDIFALRPRSPLDELRDAHPDLVRRAEQAAHEHATRDPVYLDHEELERWIVARVLDLGWLPESRGGPYDQPWTFTSTRSSEDKIERIGKKYSWIAHQELLAILVQHCQRKRWDGELVSDHTMWELVHTNDIDPTVTVRGDVPPTDTTSGRLLARTRRPNPHVWWLKGWESPMSAPENTDDRWLRTDDDIPDARHLMSRTDPHGNEWVVLESHVQWQIDRPGDKPGSTPHRRDMWFRTQAYLCAADAQQGIRSWSAGKDWMGLWMPTPPTYGLGYFRDYPTSEPWSSWYRQSRIERTNPPAEPPALSDFIHEAHPHLADAWEEPTEHGYPRHPIALATYGNNASTDTDMSAKSSPVCLLPSPVLVSLLALSHTPAGAPDELGLGSAELEFRWSRDGEVVMFGTDGWTADAPRALMVRSDALMEVLAEAGLTWWSWILGEKISWEHGDPTGERLNMFGAGGPNATTAWETWTFDSQFHDYGTR